MVDLTQIGLSENESKVYMALLDNGALPVSRIHEETGIDRRNIYDVLNRLISKGLATFAIENKKRIFQITSPKRIMLFLEDQKQTINEKKKIAKKILSRLESKFEARTSSAEAEIYRGYEGIKTIWEDTLNYKEAMMIGAGGFGHDRMPRYWIAFNRKRIKRGIRWKELVIDSMRNHPMLKEKLIESKFLPKELTGPPNVIWIYGSKVTNILWLETTPIAFVVHDRQIAESYRRYFNFLWDKVAKW
ncbi:MAG: TrmB family transcriptional regulator [Candidatus Aenigmarchaeota archaeon]|nr:TrmB family transcriptional regulator [Candidatus Aenigmarchaeota archaeon]